MTEVRKTLDAIIGEASAFSEYHGHTDDAFRRIVSLSHDLERQLEKQCVGDLGDYLEAVERGVALWHYMDMMLFPKLEGLWESIEASHAVRREVEAERDEAREKLASVEAFGDKLAKGHVSGTWQGLVKRKLDAILAEVKGE